MYLGLTRDDRLKLDQNTTKLVTQNNDSYPAFLGFSHLRLSFKNNTLWLINKAPADSIVGYGNQAYGNASRHYFSDVERSQVCKKGS